MKLPDFGMPSSLSDFPFAGPQPLDWETEPEGIGWNEEFEQMAESMLMLLYDLPEVDKLRVFLDAIKVPQMGRRRKDICRDLARAANRSDKDVVGLPDAEKARLFCRTLAKLDRQTATMVTATAIAECYVPAAKRLIAQLDGDTEKAWQLFQADRKEIPDRLWETVFQMVQKEGQLKPGQTASIRVICKQVGSLERRFALPFAVSGSPELIPLERHLLDMHDKDPATAKPLIAGLVQLNPNRAENWFLFGLTGAMAGQPQGVAERAWQLAGQFYRWGDDLATVDKPFDPERVKANADAIRALFTDPNLASAKKLVGEYIFRQLVLIRERSLAVELLSPEMVRQYSKILTPIILVEAHARAMEKNLEAVRALASRFPEVRSHGLVAMTLRRTGQLQEAGTELRNSKAELPGERALLEANISDAFELAIPEDPVEQKRLIKRLEPFDQADEEFHPEVCYCRALYQIAVHDRDLASEAYGGLLGLPDRYLGVRAYRFLAALLSQEPESISDELDEIQDKDPEEVLAFLPINLLKASIRALAIMPDPGELSPLTQFFYDHTPELLDSLLGHEELLATNPALLARLLDNQDNLSDPIQRWASYQKVIQLSAKAQEPDLMARALDGCLSIKDPLLGPYQAKLLQEQITQCADVDLKEELAERITSLNPEQGKAYLYELLHAYLGNDRREDAWRMVEALRELNETSADLDQCVGVLQPQFEPTSKTRRISGKLPFPISVCFYGGEENDKLRTEPLRHELMGKHPGLTVEFAHNAWNLKNWANLVNSVEKFDVVCASNLMRTDISRGIRRRARELGKTFGFCRNRGLGTIAETILKAVEVHLSRKS